MYWLQLENGEVSALCRELAKGKVLPAGWSSDYDNQNRQYFVDEVYQKLSPVPSYKQAFSHESSGTRQHLLMGRSRKRALGNILCCHTTEVLCSWPREETQQWPRLKQQSHAQPQRFDLVPVLHSYARPCSSITKLSDLHLQECMLQKFKC